MRQVLLYLLRHGSKYAELIPRGARDNEIETSYGARIQMQRNLGSVNEYKDFSCCIIEQYKNIYYR